MRILITGGRGQLASDLLRSLRGDDVLALGHDDLDITRPDQIRESMEQLRPDVVINTAAYHRVDVCENEPDRSFAVNAAAPQRLARECGRIGATFVHLSTDYVFDGQKTTPYVEDDPVNPLSVYAASKAAGEMAVRSTIESHLVVRTSGLYGHAGGRTSQGNFAETMLRLAKERKPIAVVHDQVLTPSYTRDVAAAIVHLVRSSVSGTFHVTNSGQCSWYEFAAEIFRLTGDTVELSPTTQAERPLPARRPAYSVLAHRRLEALGIPQPRPWQEALAAYLAERSPQFAARGSQIVASLPHRSGPEKGF